MQHYLADLIGISVLNQSKEKIGKLLDLVAIDINKPHPRIKGIVIKRGQKKEAVFAPEYDISTITSKMIRLGTDIVDLTPFIPKNDEILLGKDFYDKQIVDIDDRRLTRVNDLLLEHEHSVLRLKGVDISFAGLMARLKIPFYLNVLKRNIVDWEDVQFLGGQSRMKFNIQYKNLESLHPVDIARIIFEGPGYKQGSKVLASLKDPIAADIIEELSPKLQKNLIESMKLEDVADVIEHMSAHKAADLLVILGNDYAQKIFPYIKESHVAKIQSLLNYPSHSTGAFMTTEYIAIPQGITVNKAFEFVHNMTYMPDFYIYLYVLENEYSNKLVGVIALDELLQADSRVRIETIMNKRYIYGLPHENIKDNLKKLYRYNVSALPIVSKTDNKLLGIVTFRDAISIYLPKRWKVRIRQVFSNGLISDINHV